MKFLKHMLAVYESGVVSNQQSQSSGNRSPINEYSAPFDIRGLLIILVFAGIIIFIAYLIHCHNRNKRKKQEQENELYNQENQNTVYREDPYASGQYQDPNDPNRPYGGSN